MQISQFAIHVHKDDFSRFLARSNEISDQPKTPNSFTEIKDITLLYYYQVFFMSLSIVVEYSQRKVVLNLCGQSKQSLFYLLFFTTDFTLIMHRQDRFPPNCNTEKRSFVLL